MNHVNEIKRSVTPSRNLDHFEIPRKRTKLPGDSHKKKIRVLVEIFKGSPKRNQSLIL